MLTRVRVLIPSDGVNQNAGTDPVAETGLVAGAKVSGTVDRNAGADPNGGADLSAGVDLV